MHMWFKNTWMHSSITFLTKINNTDQSAFIDKDSLKSIYTNSSLGMMQVGSIIRK